MRSYGKKFLKSRMREPAETTLETRDAIIWSINVLERYCEVKVQGSNESIFAYFPQGWQNVPSWMKAGIAAKINHMGGVRGRIEVIGPGQFIPTAVIGGNLPDAGSLSDAVLSGGRVGESTPTGMSVTVQAATYRINGVEYSSPETTLAIAAAPGAGYYRYDVIYADTGGTVHVEQGTPAGSNPTMPSIPAGTIQLGYVLVVGGISQVTQNETNLPWSAQILGHLEVVPADDDLAWNETSTTVTVSVYDQYGQPYSIAAPGLYITLEFDTIGNGTLHSDEEGDSTTLIGAHAGAGQNHYHFTYTRDQLTTDQSVVLKATCVVAGRTITGYGSIILRNQAGLPMGGTDVDHIQLPLTRMLFPEYPGAVMTGSGSNNDAGTLGMTSDFETISNVIYNYYQWASSISSGLQSYDINVKYLIPENFMGFVSGTNSALTLGIKTEENTADNNKIDVTIRKDGSATTSSLTAQKSSVAATWETVGFDESDTVLNSLGKGDVLNITIRLYSQNSKYARVGKISLATAIGQ